MKFLFKTAFNQKTSYLYFGTPEGHEGTDQAPTNALRPKGNPRRQAQTGIDQINKNLGSIDQISPEAGNLIGNKLPQMVKNGIKNPADLARMSRSAREAEQSIRTQLDKSEGNNEISAETTRNALDYIAEINTILDKSYTEIQTKLQEDPNNAGLKTVAKALFDTKTNMRDLEDAIKENPNYLATITQQEGSTGDLARRVAQIAEGKIGMQEGTTEADSFNGVDTNKTPWCRAFVNAVIREAGGDAGDSLMAREATGQGGSGHIGIKVGNRVIAGNSADRVRYESASKFTEYNTIDNLNNGVKTSLGPVSGAPEIAIVTKGRGSNNKSEA